MPRFIHQSHGSLGPGAQPNWKQECKAQDFRYKEAPSEIRPTPMGREDNTPEAREAPGTPAQQARE